MFKYVVAAFLFATVELLSTWEVWRARKRRASGNSSLLSALQTFQVHNFSTYTQLKHELIVLYIIKAINTAVNLKFLLVVVCTQSSTMVYVTIFYVKFLSWNWEKVIQIAWDNIKKDCKIHIEVPENY